VRDIVSRRCDAGWQRYCTVRLRSTVSGGDKFRWPVRGGPRFYGSIPGCGQGYPEAKGDKATASPARGAGCYRFSVVLSVSSQSAFPTSPFANLPLYRSQFFMNSASAFSCISPSRAEAERIRHSFGSRTQSSASVASSDTLQDVWRAPSLHTGCSHELRHPERTSHGLHPLHTLAVSFAGRHPHSICKR
jgi:hypothetical protein